MNTSGMTRLPHRWNELAAFMKSLPAWKNHRLEWVAETGSTSDDLKTDWHAMPRPARLRTAGYQSSGRGQRGRHWVAAPEDGLLFSFSWDWLNPDSAWEIPFRTGLAVRDALVPFVDDERSLWLKWPNDLCAGTGKLGGILIESTCCEGALQIIVGIGINLRLPESPFETADGPGMRPAAINNQNDAIGAPCAATSVGILKNFLAAWVARLDPTPDELTAAYACAASPFWGRNVRIILGDGAVIEGRAMGLAEKGALEVAEKTGGRRIIRDARRLILQD